VQNSIDIDNGYSEKPKVRGEIISGILIGILIIFSILYLFASFAAPVRKVNQINNAFNDTITPDLWDKTYPYPDHPALFDLYKEKIFLESRLEMARTGSIGLVVNLGDSTLNIEIGGIKLHSAVISKYRVSRIFRSIDNKAYLGLFSKPFTTVRNSGTFVKEPIVVKKAPRDTIQAARQASVPDSIKTGPAYIAMTLDYNIRLSLYQEGTGSIRAGLYRFVFKSGRRFRQAGETSWGAVTFKIPEFRPEIRVFIPKEDLVTIYRALPVDSHVVIKI
jgi:hypothetical protein